VLARQAAPDPSDFARLTPTDADIEVTSQMATKEALDALAQFEQLRYTAEDVLLQVAPGIVSDFLTFIWFIASEIERIGQILALSTLRRLWSTRLHGYNSAVKIDRDGCLQQG